MLRKVLTCIYFLLNREKTFTNFRKDSPSPKKKVRVTFERHSPDSNDDIDEFSEADDALGGEGAEASSADVLQALLSPSNSPAVAANGDPPDPEVLIQALQDLENAASSDAEVRDKISKFPTEVSDVSHLERIKSPDECRALMQKVCEHHIECFLITELNSFFTRWKRHQRYSTNTMTNSNKN